MHTIKPRPLYRRHLAPQGFDEPEYLTTVPTPLVGFMDCHAINAHIVCNAPGSTPEAELLLGMLDEDVRRAGSVNPISRVEFLHHPGTETRLGLRGAVLYDSTGQPVFHFVNALIGYSGSGPALSREILRALGVNDYRIDQINEGVRTLMLRKLPYVVIVELDETVPNRHWQFVVLLD